MSFGFDFATLFALSMAYKDKDKPVNISKQKTDRPPMGHRSFLRPWTYLPPVGYVVDHEKAGQDLRKYGKDYYYKHLNMGEYDITEEEFWDRISMRKLSAEYILSGEYERDMQEKREREEQEKKKQEEQERNNQEN